MYHIEVLVKENLRLALRVRSLEQQVSSSKHLGYALQPSRYLNLT